MKTNVVEFLESLPLEVRGIGLCALILALGILLWRELRIRRIHADAARKEAWNDKG